MGIFSSLKKDKLALVFDLGSSSVGAALFYMRSSESPEIIYITREPIPLEKKIDPDKFTASSLKTLKNVAEKVAAAGMGAPEKIFCVLSSPWYASQTRHIQLSKQAPFVFSAKLADSLTKKEMSMFEEENNKASGHPDNKIRAIEFRTMKTVLNGYATPSPIGQKATELDMTVFLSMSPEKTLKQVEQAIESHFPHREVKFSSFAMASFAVARDMFIHQNSFLLVDIGGEVSEISMIKEDVIAQSISFPKGRNFMIRGVAENMDCTLDEARSLLSLYKDGHAAGTVEKALQPVIDKLKSDWLAQFQDSLSNLSTDISIPATIFITVDSDLTGFFSDIIKTEQFSQYTLTESKFRVIFLGTEALHGIATFRENTPRDPFLIIESIYINRFIKVQ